MKTKLKFDARTGKRKCRSCGQATDKRNFYENRDVTGIKRPVCGWCYIQRMIKARAALLDWRKTADD